MLLGLIIAAGFLLMVVPVLGPEGWNVKTLFVAGLPLLLLLVWFVPRERVFFTLRVAYILAMILGIPLGLLLFLRDSKEMVDVWVARENIAAGTKIDVPGEWFTTMQVPRQDVPKGIVNEPAQMKGKIARVAIPKGAWCKPDDLVNENDAAKSPIPLSVPVGERYHAAIAALHAGTAKLDHDRLVGGITTVAGSSCCPDGRMPTIQQLILPDLTRVVEEKANLRREGLQWLLAELAAWEKRVFAEPEEVHRKMRFWQNDRYLEIVREADALQRLPEAEREEWMRFWQFVRGLELRAAQAGGRR
jgi:hypothetical protein